MHFSEVEDMQSAVAKLIALGMSDFDISEELQVTKAFVIAVRYKLGQTTITNEGRSGNASLLQEDALR